MCLQVQPPQPTLRHRTMKQQHSTHEEVTGLQLRTTPRYAIPHANRYEHNVSHPVLHTLASMLASTDAPVVDTQAYKHQHTDARARTGPAHTIKASRTHSHRCMYHTRQRGQASAMPRAAAPGLKPRPETPNPSPEQSALQKSLPRTAIPF